MKWANQNRTRLAVSKIIVNVKFLTQHQAHRPQKIALLLLLLFLAGRRVLFVGWEQGFGSERVNVGPAAPSATDKVGGNTVPSPFTVEFMRCWLL